MEEKPYRMQVRTFLKDGVPTYHTVATVKVIPFWYNGDIIYLGLGSATYNMIEIGK